MERFCKLSALLADLHTNGFLLQEGPAALAVELRGSFSSTPLVLSREQSVYVSDETRGMSTGLIVKIISKCVVISKYHTVYLKIYILFTKYVSNIQDFCNVFLKEFEFYNFSYSICVQYKITKF